MAKKRYSPEEDSGSNLSQALGISEHTVIRMMAGEADVLRLRLVSALEQLGYRVIDENPLRAKHGARGYASSYMSANALDYPTTIEVGLKQSGKGSTKVTFDYSVIHGHFGKGDRQSLTREAEAIIALAAHRAAQTNCIVCGADFISDSRFCRKCGAPTSTAIPAELEVMRLTANVRAGHQWTLIGAFILAAGTIMPLITLLAIDFASYPKGAKALLVVGMILAGLGWWAMGGGIRKTHRTLNPRDSDEDDLIIPRRHQSFVPASIPDTNELPDESEGKMLSVTEHTTGLLNDASSSEREPVPIYRSK